MAVEKIGLEAALEMAGWSKSVDQYNKDVEGMSGKTEKSAGIMQKALGTAMGYISGQAVLGAVKNVVNGIRDMAQEAATVPAITQQFERMGGSIEEMRKGSAGLIADTDLMKSFNQAASLVSADFAQQLPKAMSLLGRAAAASGQDVNYMLSSLVTGVGRVSPMILDNLGIQVSLTEATEAYAAKLGKSTKELSKQEQQAAVMEVVMSKLEGAYGGMQDVSESAQAQMAAFGVQMKNFRTQIGVAVLPIMTSFMGGLSKLANTILPKVTGAIKTLERPISLISEAIESAFGMIGALLKGDVENALEYLWEVINNIGAAFGMSRKTIATITDVVHAFTRVLSVLFGGDYLTGYKIVADFLASLGLGARPVNAVMNALLNLRDAVQSVFDWFSRIPAAFETLKGAMSFLITGEYEGGLKTFMDGLYNLGVSAAGLGPAVTFLQKLRDAIGGVISTLVAGFQGWENSTISFVKTLDKLTSIGIPPDLATAILNIAMSIGEFAKDVYNAYALLSKGDIAGWFKGMLQAWAGLGAGILDALKSIDWAGIWKKVGAALVAAAGTIKDFASKAWAKLKKWFEDTVTEIKNKVQSVDWQSVWAKVRDWLADKAAAIKDFAGKAWAKLKKWFEDTVTEIKNKVTSIDWRTIWERVRDWLADRAADIKDFATKAWAKLKKWFDDTVTEIKNKVQSVDWRSAWEKIRDVLSEAAGRVGDAAQKIANAIFKWFTDSIDKLKQKVDQWAINLGFVPDATAEALKDAAKADKIEKIAIAIRDWILAATKWLEEHLAPLIESFSKVLIAMAQKMQGELGKPQSEASKAMGAAFDAILRAAFTLLTSPILWQAFWDVIVASIALNETIKTRIQDKIKEVGMSIVEGIVLGIEAKAGEVATAIEDWIMENVVTVVKKALHMASPSKVMIQLGEEVGEGFILGIEASSDDVLKAVVNMADKVVSLVQGMVEAFEGMAKAPVTTHLAAWGQAISDALTVVMNALVALYDYAGGPQANKIDLARRLAVTFDNVVGFVQDAADALASLNTVDVLAVTKEKVQGFMDAVTIILEAIKEATGIWSAGLTGTKGEKTIDETFAPARKFVEQIAAMLSVVELAVTSINHMATLNLAKDIKAKARDFATGLNTLLVEIFKATDIWTHKTPDEMGAAASFAQSAQQMLSVVTVAVEAITSLFDFAPARDLPEKAKIFAAGLNYVLVEIYKASLIWKDTGLEAAALFAANAEQVIAIISSAIEAISQLGTFTAVTDMRAKARAFAANIVALMDELDKALIALVLPSRGAPTVPLTAEEISERFAALGAFGEAVEGGIGFIQSAISAISSISGFKAIGGLGEKVRTFMEQVISLMANLEDALLTTLMEPSGKVPDVAYTPEKIIERFGKLIAFSDAVQTGIGFIQPALDAIASLTDYVVVEGLGKTVHAFASQVVSLMSNLEDAMIEIMEPSGMAPTTPFTPEKITERFSRLAAFASAVQAGIGFIAPAIEAIAKLATFTPIASLGKKAHGFAEQVISLMSNLEDALISIMEPSGATPVIQFTPEQIVERFAKLASFSEAVQKGIGFIAPSIDALLKLGEFERVKDLKKKLQWLTADLEELLLQFSYMARLWIAQTAEGVFQSEALSKLGDFATKVAAAVGFIVPSIEALGEVRKYKAASNLVKDIGAFTHDLSLLLEELGRIADKLAGDQGLGRAQAFESAAAAISGAVSRGLELLGVLSIETGDAPAGFASSIRGALLEIKTAAKDLKEAWVSAWGAITTAVQLATRAVNEFKTALEDVTIPEDLAPGSPPPFAYAMQDIALATRRAKEEFGLLRGELRAYTLPSSVMAAQTAAAVANNNVNVNMGGVAINNGMDEAILAAKVRRWVKEAMRP